MQELTCLNLLALIPLDTVRPLGGVPVVGVIVDNVSKSSLCFPERMVDEWQPPPKAWMA